MRGRNKERGERDSWLKEKERKIKREGEIKRE
jgi:hypothetical protein